MVSFSNPWLNCVFDRRWMCYFKEQLWKPFWGTWWGYSLVTCFPFKCTQLPPLSLASDQGCASSRGKFWKVDHWGNKAPAWMCKLTCIVLGLRSRLHFVNICQASRCSHLLAVPSSLWKAAGTVISPAPPGAAARKGNAPAKATGVSDSA